MKRIRMYCLMFVLLLAAGWAGAQADKPFLAPLFTDNMVLQRGVKDALWGWSTPGATVTVEVNGKHARATADAQGKWLVKIGPFKAGGPYALTVAGPKTVTLKNLLFGDVWICSGQSNMDLGIKGAANAEAEIAAANYPQIRFFVVNKAATFAPQELLGGEWKVCTPETVAADGWQGFSAVAYFFGRQLHHDLHVPIGLVLNAWSGMPAEPFITSTSLKTMPEYAGLAKQLELTYQDPPGALVNFAKDSEAWWAANDPGLKAGWQNPVFDATAWSTMALPQLWQKGGLNYFGLVWFRKDITLPPAWEGQPAVLHLGPIAERDIAWVNGVEVGVTGSHEHPPCDYPIPKGVLKAGRNVIAVSVLGHGGQNGFAGQPEQMKLEWVGTANAAAPVTLAGPWQYQPGARANTLPINTLPELITGTNPYCPTMINNGMVHPLLPMALTGAIWYQGETNTERAAQYRRVLPLLITDWRTQFGQGDFPFLVVQLANLGTPPQRPEESDWAVVREAQMLAGKTLRNVGLAVTIDIGEADNIHPKNKQEVGHRLALAAEAIAYKQKIAYSGPLYKAMKVEGSSIRLSFDHVNGGLVAKGKDTLTGFAICGAEHKFVWANARIDGNTILVSSPDIPNPVAVRYAWAGNPTCNLYNLAGLPASPFRTDEGEVSSEQ